MAAPLPNEPPPLNSAGAIFFQADGALASSGSRVCMAAPCSRGEDQPRSFFLNFPLKIPVEFRRALRGFRQWQLPWRCRQCSARAVKGRHAVRLKLAPLSDEERIARRMRRRNLGRAGNGSRESDVPSRSLTTGASTFNTLSGGAIRGLRLLFWGGSVLPAAERTGWPSRGLRCGRWGRRDRRRPLR
jgi:hypothetical protein